MAPSKVAVFLALTLALLAATAHGCAPYCPTAPIIPPPVVPKPSTGRCSIVTLKFEVCANVLNLLKLNLGVPANEECCPLLSGLADLDAAVCLCTAISANILGINLNVPVDLTLLLNQCGKICPTDFTCRIWSVHPSSTYIPSICMHIMHTPNLHAILIYYLRFKE